MKTKGNEQNIKAIKRWLEEIYDYGDETGISIQEIKCADESCPCVETIIITVQGNTINKIKIGKPLIYIRKWDIENSILV